MLCLCLRFRQLLGAGAYQFLEEWLLLWFWLRLLPMAPTAGCSGPRRKIDNEAATCAQKQPNQVQLEYIPAPKPIQCSYRYSNCHLWVSGLPAGRAPPHESMSG
jgi:hypothetical protein